MLLSLAKSCFDNIDNILINRLTNVSASIDVCVILAKIMLLRHVNNISVSSSKSIYHQI